MTHHASGMPCTQDASKWLGQVISRVDNPRCMFHCDVSFVFPTLDGKEAHANASGLSGRFVDVDCLNCRLVVIACWGWILHQQSQFLQN